jgi:hypothetical protein
MYQSTRWYAQKVHVQDVTTLVLMPKIRQGFGNVLDVMACYISWANVGKYIERIKTTRKHHASSYGGTMTNHKT